MHLRQNAIFCFFRRTFTFVSSVMVVWSGSVWTWRRHTSSRSSSCARPPIQWADQTRMATTPRKMEPTIRSIRRRGNNKYQLNCHAFIGQEENVMKPLRLNLISFSLYCTYLVTYDTLRFSNSKEGRQKERTTYS